MNNVHGGKGWQGLGNKFAALILCAEICMILVPGCVIHIGPGAGSGSETQPNPTMGAGGDDSSGGGKPTSGAGGGTADLTPEEQAAFNELQKLDPAEVILKSATAQYAAVASSNLVESQVQDPNIVDPALLQQLLDQSVQIANGEALAWMSTADVSALSDNVKIPANYECMFEPYTCKHPQFCPLGDSAICVTSGCGKGACPWCTLFGNIYYESYCTYACMQGSKYWGYGFTLRERFSHTDTPFVCLPFPK